MEHRAKRIGLPKREVHKHLFTLPDDLVVFLDDCANATGQDRSGFLTLVLDGFYDEIASFAKGYAARIVELMAIAEMRNKKK